MAVCSWIAIPTAIPITMQTFAVFLTLNFLGGKKGTVSVCIYLLLGLIGLPVYANFTSGIGMLMGTTGGYMIGWILSGLAMWLLEKLLGRKLWVQAVSMLIGLTVCYVAGTAWFMVVYARNIGPVGLWTALLWCVLPFIVPDLAKLGKLHHDDEKCFWTDTYYSSCEEMEQLYQRHGITVIDHFAQDGLTPQFSETADKWTKAQFKVWCDYHYSVCREKTLLGASNHVVIVGKK